MKIKKNPSSFASNDSIKENIVNVFANYFNDQKLGKLIDIQNLNSSIFAVNGVESFSTERTLNDQNISVNGLSFMIYNHIYFEPNEDIGIVTQSFQLPFFKASYYENYDALRNNIIIE